MKLGYYELKFKTLKFGGFFISRGACLINDNPRTINLFSKQFVYPRFSTFYSKIVEMTSQSNNQVKMQF